MPAAAQHLPDAESLAADRGVDLELFQCSGCGLVQLVAPPVSYYREVIRAAAISRDMQAFRTSQFGAFVRDHKLIGRKVVEIGCGRGEYLEIMRKAGAEASGLEYSAEAVDYCRTRGLAATCGFVDTARSRLPHTPYAAFFMLNFLEHLPHPCETLSGIGENLEEGGVGLVEVPNFDMILRRRLMTEIAADHLLYFTRETLGFALQKSGFELLSADEVWSGYILSAIVRKRSRLNLADYTETLAALKRNLHGYLDRFPPLRVAVWGAGHQALAVLAATGVAHRVKYVVDSAPFKQGRFTPATHLPIVAPERLDSDPVDAVMVMAAGYSDEVADRLRKRTGPAVAVAILRETGLETSSPVKHG